MNEYPPQEPYQPFNDPTQQQYPQQQSSFQQNFPSQPGGPPNPNYPPQQQPPTQYPPSYQPPYQPYVPPPPPPAKPSFWKRKVGCLPMWAIILILIIVCYGIGSAATHSATNAPVTQDTSTATATTQPTATDTPAATDTPTPVPTQAPAKWTTTHTFSGNGSKKSGTFSVPDDWKIVWKCNPASFSIAYNVIITVYNSDATYADSGVNATCSKSNTHDETEEHASGSVYLDIVSEGDWTIQIQELK